MSLRKDTYVWAGIALALGLIIVGITLFIIQLSRPVVTIRLGDGVFKAWVADTQKTQAKGLGGIDELPQERAMLFVFDVNGLHPVWMKDMAISIDIVWLDESKKVIYIEKNVHPNTFPKNFRPKQPARYVLEFAAGTVDTKNILVGNYAVFNETGR